MSDLVLIQPEGQAWWSGGEVPFRVVELNGKREVMVNVTAMLAGVGKTWSRYQRLEGSQELIAHAESVLQICRTELVQTIQGGDPQFQGTWAIKTIALAAAAWASTPLHWWVLETALAKIEGRSEFEYPAPGTPWSLATVQAFGHALIAATEAQQATERKVAHHDQHLADHDERFNAVEKQLNFLLPPAKKKVTPSKATKKLLWSVWEDHFSNVCPCCKKPTRRELMEIEHWNSSQQAGHDDLWVTCRSCNVKMGKPVGDGGRKRTEDQRRAWDTFQDLKNLRVKSDAGQQTSIFDHL